MNKREKIKVSYEKMILTALTNGNEKDIKNVISTYLKDGYSFNEFGNIPEALSDVIAFHGSLEGMKLAKEYDQNLENNVDILKQACYFYSQKGNYTNCINFMIDNNIGTQDSENVAKAIDLLEERINFLNYMGEDAGEIKKIVTRLAKGQEK